MGSRAESSEQGRPSKRCEEHGLAVSPDGRCALCRSASLRPPRPYQVWGPAWVLGGLLGAILAVSASAIAYKALRSGRDAASNVTAEPTATGPSLPQAEPGTGEATPEATSEAPHEPHQGESIPLAEAVPTSPLTLAEGAPAPAPSAPTAGASSPVVAPKLAPSRPPPTQAELRAALGATPVVMYATTWCGVCRQARAFLSANGFTFREIDADATPGAWDEVQRLGGKKAVPVIVVDGDVSVGFSPKRIMGSATRSMEKRLGFQGIRFE